MSTNRRRFLQGVAASVAMTALPVSAVSLTPRQSAGPFYPDQPPLDNDNDLVQVAGHDATGVARRDQGLDTAARAEVEQRVDLAADREVHEVEGGGIDAQHVVVALGRLQLGVEVGGDQQPVVG